MGVFGKSSRKSCNMPSVKPPNASSTLVKIWNPFWDGWIIDYPNDIALTYLKIVAFFCKVPEIVLVWFGFLQIKVCVNQSCWVPIPIMAYTFIVTEWLSANGVCIKGVDSVIHMVRRDLIHRPGMVINSIVIWPCLYGSIQRSDSIHLHSSIGILLTNKYISSFPPLEDRISIPVPFDQAAAGRHSWDTFQTLLYSRLAPYTYIVLAWMTRDLSRNMPYHCTGMDISSCAANNALYLFNDPNPPEKHQGELSPYKMLAWQLTFEIVYQDTWSIGLDALRVDG